MAVSQAQRLRRAAQKASRRKAVVAEKRKAESAFAAGEQPRQIAAAAQGPVRRCLVSPEMQETGIGWVVLARALPSGLLGASFFLVDIWCLGVKDVFFTTMSLEELEEEVERVIWQGPALVAIDPARARGLVQGAVAFAAAVGLEAAKGYRAAEKLFGDIEPATEGLAFGRNGDPFYLPGPHDTHAFARRIDAAIDRFLGAREALAAGAAPALDGEGRQ